MCSLISLWATYYLQYILYIDTHTCIQIYKHTFIHTHIYRTCSASYHSHLSPQTMVSLNDANYLTHMYA